MKTPYEKAVARLLISIFVIAGLLLLFASRLGGGANTGGVFPAPLLIIGLLGLPVGGIFFLVSVVQVILARREGSKPEGKEEHREP